MPLSEAKPRLPRCVIVGAADIADSEGIRAYLRPDDFIVYCDAGLRHMDVLRRRPDLIVGDFDSHENPHMDAETIVLPHEKDDTDTCFAAKEALRRGYRDFLLLGVTGGRIDHTLGNLALLQLLDSAGAIALAVDDWTEMEIVSRRTAVVSGRYPYFSLLNISGLARGITVTGAKYPLRDAELRPEDGIGVSNEPLPGRTAEISVREGRLLLVRVRE